MRNLRHSTLWLLIGWLLIGIVVYFSLYPRPQDLAPMRHDKIAHFIAYTGLMGWFVQIYYQKPALVKIGIALAALGSVLEMIQGMMPTRSFSLLDISANGAGVAAGFFLSLTPVARILQKLDGGR